MFGGLWFEMVFAGARESRKKGREKDCWALPTVASKRHRRANESSSVSVFWRSCYWQVFISTRRRRAEKAKTKWKWDVKSGVVQHVSVGMRLGITINLLGCSDCISEQCWSGERCSPTCSARQARDNEFELLARKFILNGISRYFETDLSERNFEHRELNDSDLKRPSQTSASS